MLVSYILLHVMMKQDFKNFNIKYNLINTLSGGYVSCAYPGLYLYSGVLLEYLCMI